MVSYHHQLNGHEFEQTPRDGGRQGSLAYCSPWGHRVGRDLVTERQGHAPATGREGEKEFRYFILRKNLILYKTWARRHEVLTKSFYGLIIGRSTVKERRKGSK